MLPILIACIAAISGFLGGYNSAVIAGALEFIAQEFALTAFMQGAIVSSILVGAIIGAVNSGKLATRFGQKPVLMGAAVVFILCSLGCMVAASAYQLIAWRTVLGLAVGISLTVGPLYISETAPARIRGALVSSIQLALTIGILFSYFADFAFTAEGDWRAMLGLGSLPALFLLVGMFFLPESPRWLILKGRKQEALKIYEKIQGKPWDDTDLRLGEDDSGEKAEWQDLLNSRVRPVLFIAAGMFLFQNFSGIDAILYYAPVVFKNAGLEGADSEILATAGLGAMNVLATILALWLVDKIGRRPLLLTGLVPMIVSLSVLSLMLSFSSPSQMTQWLSIISLSIFVIFYAISLGLLPYVIMSEVFPAKVRGMGMGLATATGWGINCLVTLFFLPAVEWVGQGPVFGFFAAICAVSFVFSYFLVPETKGRTLEHIERNLYAGKPIRDLGD